MIREKQQQQKRHTRLLDFLAPHSQRLVHVQEAATFQFKPPYVGDSGQTIPVVAFTPSMSTAIAHTPEKQIAFSPMSIEEMSALTTLDLSEHIEPPDARSTRAAQSTEISLPTPVATPDLLQTDQQPSTIQHFLSRHDIGLIFSFFLPWKHTIIIMTLLTTGIALGLLIIPFYIQPILERIIYTHSWYLFCYTTFLLSCIFASREILYTCGSNLYQQISQKVLEQVLRRTYQQLLYLPLTFYQGLYSTGRLVTILNELFDAQQLIFQFVCKICFYSFVMLCSLCILTLTEWHLGLLATIILPCLLLSTIILQRKQHTATTIERHLLSLRTQLYYTLLPFRTIKVLLAEPHVILKARQLLTHIQQQLVFLQHKHNIQGLQIGIIRLFCVMLFLDVCGYLILVQHILTGHILAGLLVLIPTAITFNSLLTVAGKQNQVTTALRNVLQIAHYPQEQHMPTELRSTALRGEIHLQQVSFCYPQTITPALQEVTLTIPAGTTLALIGPDGAGKTTLLHLLMRFYQPDQGVITFDNQNINDYRIDILRHQMGVILPGEEVFTGTITENLTFGLQHAVSFEELEEAAHYANILHVIRSLPARFETEICPQDTLLSHGELQRIAIARLFLRQPTILLIDEATSKVDTTVDSLTQQALRRLRHGRTTIIVSHHQGLLREVEKIAVLMKGQIIEQGTHADLCARRGTYWHWYKNPRISL
ncbi:MAG TPA: ABC transporter ATP-binding protein [Dictyobacter sp.]|jgi:ABC-type bacteriocin/lantibiotic exporter with double-glycine peptidase domain|nr:ABC transporter ATP-binding protein [Dictyobacter sp.]